MLDGENLRVARRQYARVDEQAAVSIFGEPRQFLAVAHRDARPGQGFDQGVGEPLRELVEGNEPVRPVAAPKTAMVPHIAQTGAVHHDAIRPDRMERVEQGLEDVRRARRRRERAEPVVQTADPRG